MRTNWFIMAALVASAASCAGAAAPGPTAPTAPVAPAAAVPAGGCAAEALAGEWRTVSGSLPFQEISLASDGSYASFLDERPFLDGTWKLQEGALVLTSDDGNTDRIDGVSCAGELIGTSGGQSVRLVRIAVPGTN